jgi:DNA-binding NtrC family response regulator
MAPQNILVVHGDPVRKEELVSSLRRQPDLAPIDADGLARAAALLNPAVDLLLLDLRLPGLDLEALRQALLPELAEPDSLDAAERRHLSRVLRHTAGNKRRAALILGISRSTLLHKVRKYHLEDG